MQTKSIPYTFVRSGYFYFSRRVPADLRQHYSYHRIVKGLGTSSPQRARVQANIEATKLDAYDVLLTPSRSATPKLTLAPI